MKKELIILGIVGIIFMLLLVLQTKDKSLIVDPSFDLRDKLEILGMENITTKPGSVLLANESELYYTNSESKLIVEEFILYYKDKYAIDLIANSRNSYTKDIVMELDSTLLNNFNIEIDKLIFLQAKNLESLKEGAVLLMQISDTTAGKIAFPRVHLMK